MARSLLLSGDSAWQQSELRGAVLNPGHRWGEDTRASPPCEGLLSPSPSPGRAGAGAVSRAKRQGRWGEGLAGAEPIPAIPSSFSLRRDSAKHPGCVSAGSGTWCTWRILLPGNTSLLKRRVSDCPALFNLCVERVWWWLPGSLAAAAAAPAAQEGDTGAGSGACAPAGQPAVGRQPEAFG